MIVSVHLADVGVAGSLAFHRARLRPREIPGLVYGLPTTLAPLSPRLLPTPTPGRVGLIAAWQDEAALDRFQQRHPIAERLAEGWRVRLRPTRIFGAWPELGPLPPGETMDDGEPVAVLTLGRLRLTQLVRFLRASAAAEGAALEQPALVASTGLAHLPRIVATFSLWRSTGEMREYVEGHARTAHRDAVRAHAARPFHHQSAFIRFRPYGAEGQWDAAKRLPDPLVSEPA